VPSSADVLDVWQLGLVCHDFASKQDAIRLAPLKDNLKMSSDEG